MINGLCTGAGLRQGVLNLEIRSGDEKPLWSIEEGDEIAIALDSDRCCIGARPPGAKSLIPCPDHVKNISSSQCPQCFAGAQILPCLRCTGERCTNPPRRDECVSPGNHAVYLAAFAPDLLKVGVARWDRREERLREQGAIAGIVIARDDGQQVRRVEAQIRKMGIVDRVAPTVKLQALTQSYRQADLVNVLEESFTHLRHRIRASWLDEPEVLAFETPIIRDQPPRLLSPHQGMSVRGTVEEVIGRTIIINSDIGETVALESQAMIGYHLRSLDNDEVSLGQMAISFGD